MKQNVKQEGLTPMDRFLGEGASEQSAVFNRADNGRISIDKGCLCIKSKQS